MALLLRLIRITLCLWVCQALAWPSEHHDRPPRKIEVDTEQIDHPPLLPAVHWDYPLGDIRNLEPTDTHDLYFSSQGISDPNLQHTFASVSMTLTHLSVVLDHSSLITNYFCIPDHIVVEFASEEAFGYALHHWTSAGSELSLVTYADGCHGGSTEQRTFWKVDELSPMNGLLAISALVEHELAFEHVIDEVNLSWGTYDPPPTSNLRARQATNTTNTLQGCGAAPASTLDNLPAAACGDPNFDQILNDALGYYDWSSGQYADSLRAFLPNVVLNSSNLTPDPLELVTRSVDLQKRGFYDSLGNFVGSAAVGVGQVLGGVVSGAVSIGSGLVSGLNTINTAGGNLLADAVTGVLGTERYAAQTTPPQPVPYNGPGTSSELFRKIGNFEKAPTKDFDTSLGAGSTIFQQGNLRIACVNCGAKATTSIIGQAIYTVSPPRVNVLTAKLGLNFQAALNIGIFADAAYNRKVTKQLLNEPIPGLAFSIPGLFTAGFSVGIDAVAELDIQAQGQAIAGVGVVIPDFTATLDLVNPQLSGVTGSPPQLSRVLQVGGQINANSKLSLPIMLVLGVKVPLVNYQQGVALVEEPSINANVAVSGGSLSSQTCPNGAAYSIGFANRIYLAITGAKPYQKVLASYDASIVQPACYQPRLKSRSDLFDVPKIRGRFPTLEARQSNTTILGNSTMTSILSEGETVFMHDPANFSVPNDNPVWNATTNPNNPQLQALSAMALAQAATTSNSDGMTYTTVVDLHSQFALVPGADGGIYAGNFSLWTADGTGLFAQKNNTIISDISGRVLHYFPNEMNAYNASRLRIANQTNVPQGSVVISLTWVNWDPSNSASPMLYMPVDSRLNIYNPVICNFGNGAPSKIFVANGQSGLNSLQSNFNTEFTVTGAPVSNCWPIALVPGMMN